VALGWGVSPSTSVPPHPSQSHYHSISTPQTLHLSNSGSCQHYSITRLKIDRGGCARHVARRETEDNRYNCHNSSAEHKFETETLGLAGLLEKAHRAMACANTWNGSKCFRIYCNDWLLHTLQWEPLSFGLFMGQVVVNFLPTFRYNLSAPSSKIQESKWISSFIEKFVELLFRIQG
jgi:hypothetical protein